MRIVEIDLDWKGLIATPYTQLSKADRTLVASRQVYPKGVFRDDLWRYAYGLDPNSQPTFQDTNRFYALIGDVNKRRLSGTRWSLQTQDKIVFLIKQFDGPMQLPPSDPRLIEAFPDGAFPAETAETPAELPRIAIAPEHRPYLVRMLRNFTDLMVQGALVTLSNDPSEVLKALLPAGLNVSEIIGETKGEPEGRVLANMLTQELGEILGKKDSGNIDELNIITNAARFNARNPNIITPAIKEKFDPPPKREKPIEIFFEEPASEPVIIPAPEVVFETAEEPAEVTPISFYERLMSSDIDQLSTPTERMTYFVLDSQGAMPAEVQKFLGESATMGDLQWAASIVNRRLMVDGYVLCHSENGLLVVPISQVISKNYISIDTDQYYTLDNLHKKPEKQRTKAEQIILLIKSSKTPLTKNGISIKLRIRLDSVDDALNLANDYLSDYNKVIVESPKGLRFQDNADENSLIVAAA